MVQRPVCLPSLRSGNRTQLSNLGKIKPSSFEDGGLVCRVLHQADWTILPPRCIRQRDHIQRENYLVTLQEFAVPQDRVRNDLANVFFFSTRWSPARLGRDFLNVKFPDQWIARRDPLEWVRRSPDLTLCDFFLWGCGLNKVKPMTCHSLRKESAQSADEIGKQTLQKVGGT